MGRDRQRRASRGGRGPTLTRASIRRQSPPPGAVNIDAYPKETVAPPLMRQWAVGFELCPAPYFDPTVPNLHSSSRRLPSTFFFVACPLFCLPLARVHPPFPLRARIFSRTHVVLDQEAGFFSRSVTPHRNGGWVGPGLTPQVLKKKPARRRGK